MSGYDSRPSGLLNVTEAIDYLRETYQVGETDAEHLLASAVRSETGMASLPRDGARTLWVTHMTTQHGTFIIELD